MSNKNNNYLRGSHITKKANEIGSGWYNYVNKDDDIEREATAKAKVCDTCVHKVKQGYLKYVNDVNPEIKGCLCEMCGCPLSMKIRSKTSKCPLYKW